MTDKELIELAAKACGYVWNGRWWMDEGIPLGDWNPLEDDGEAFQLQCGFAIDISFVPGPWQVHAVRWDRSFPYDECREEYDDDRKNPSAVRTAVRRVIVRVVAEQGKRMS